MKFETLAFDDDGVPEAATIRLGLEQPEPPGGKEFVVVKCRIHGEGKSFALTHNQAIDFSSAAMNLARACDKETGDEP